MSERIADHGESMVQPEQEAAGSPPLSMLWPRVALALCLAVVTFHLCARAGTEALATDEVAHAHAAWLLHVGELPYLDFFEIHPPYYWWSLRPALSMFGEGMALFYWGRGLSVALFLASVLLLGLIGRAWFGEVVGLAAAAVAAVSRFAQRPAIQMRPDGLALFLLLLGTYLAWRAWTSGFRRAGALLAGTCFGLAVATHHQAAYSLFALALAFAWGLHARGEWALLRQRAASVSLFALGLLAPVVLPFLLYGAATYHRHAYVLHGNQLPGFEPWGRFGALFVGDFALLPFALLSLAACSLLLARKGSTFSTPDLALLLLVLFNALGVALASRPLTHVFLMFTPFVALLAARTVPVVLGALGPQHRSLALALFIGAGLMSNMNPRRWEMGTGLEENAAYLAWAAEVIPEGGSYAGQLRFHPVFVRDGSPYWTDLDLDTLKAEDPNWSFDLLAHLDRSRPFLVHQLVNQRGTGGGSEEARIRDYIREHYQRIEGTEFLRRRP